MTEYTRVQDRLNSTAPIYSRILSLAHPTRQLKFEYMRKNLHNCSADHLASRLLEQIQEHDKLKITMFDIENRNRVLEKNLQTIMTLFEGRNVDQLKLAQIQEKNSEKIKQLQQEISVKASGLNNDTYWESRYKELNKYMMIYTSEINVIQEQFRSQHTNINAQLQNSQAMLKNESSRKEDLTRQLSNLKNQIEQLQQKCIKLDEEKKLHEDAFLELEEQNNGLLASSKIFSNELERCTQLIDKLFKDIKEKQLEVQEKDVNISHLENHLNISIDEIEKLNEMIRSSIDSDDKAIHEIQRLDLKVSESKSALQLVKSQAQDKLLTIPTLENEVKSLLQTNDLMKQMTRDLESKMVTALANQQHHRKFSEERQEKLQQFESELSRIKKENNKNIEKYEDQIKRLKNLIEEKTVLYQGEVKENSLILQQLKEHKKLSTRKNILMGNTKERNKEQRGKEFRLNDFQMKLDHNSATRSGFQASNFSREATSSDLSNTRSKTGRDTSPEDLHRIVEQISHKVNQLAEVQANMNLRYSIQPQSDSGEEQANSKQNIKFK